MKKDFEFNEEQVPYGLLGQYGLTREMVEDLPEAPYSDIMNGLLSPVLPVSVKDDEGNEKEIDNNMHKIILQEDWRDTDWLKEQDFALAAPVTYVGRTNSKENSRFLYALGFDLDGVGIEQLDNLFYQMKPQVYDDGVNLPDRWERLRWSVTERMSFPSASTSMRGPASAWSAASPSSGTVTGEPGWTGSTSASTGAGSRTPPATSPMSLRRITPTRSSPNSRKPSTAMRGTLNDNDHGRENLH